MLIYTSVTKTVQRRYPSGHRQRITSESSTLEYPIGAVKKTHNLSSPSVRTNWGASTDDLAHRYKIRGYPG
jgi:hypothetical protein